MSNEKMPALFIGHGSPMNAIETNRYTRWLGEFGRELPRPRAILVISAHWMTRGETLVTEMARPRTIHDFYGFPEALFSVEYPASGNPEVAGWVRSLPTEPPILGDPEKWGLDHGAWSVLRHLYPEADVPVVQLSLDMTRPPSFHFELGRALAPLRDRGVMILGSGNLVHNLRLIRWESDAPAYDWATEFDAWAKERLLSRDYRALVEKFQATEAGKLSVPTLDHYLPILAVLGSARPDDALRIEYEEMQNASISMLSFSLGR